MAKFDNITFKHAKAAYPVFLAAKPIMGQGEPVYSCTVLIPKNAPDIAEKLELLKGYALIDCGGKKMPPNYNFPIRDGDAQNAMTGDFVKKQEHYRGHYYFTTKSKFQPTIVVGREQANFYDLDVEHEGSGWECWIECNPYSWSMSGNMGMSLGLQSVWLRKKGEPIIAGGNGNPFAGESGDGDDLDSVADVKTKPFSGGGSGSGGADALNDLLT